MATTTGRAIATKALKLIGAVGQGQTPAVHDLNDTFGTLNDLVDEWGADNLTIYVTERATFPLTSGVGSYTLGSGGTFNRVRPVFLDLISIVTDLSNEEELEIPLEVLDLGQYQGLPVKNVQSALPTKAYRDFAFPLMNVKFWPVPNVGGLTAVLYCPTALTEFTTLDTSYSMPPSYKNALQYNLALRIAPQFGRQVRPDVFAIAAETLGNVRRANIRPQQIPVDAALIARSDRFNFYTGEQE